VEVEMMGFEIVMLLFEAQMVFFWTYSIGSFTERIQTRSFEASAAG